jgi:hypothetical protein
LHRAAILQFERIVDEFVRWRDIPDDERSPAPAWWWGPAFELLGVQNALPLQTCSSLELSDGATYTDGAEVFLKPIAGQTSLPWLGNFPRRPADPTPN